MIRKTVYFRTQGDLDKFNALPNKAEWLQQRLNHPTLAELVEKRDAAIVELSDTIILEPVITQPEDVA